jgi:hypothetical protein
VSWSFPRFFATNLSQPGLGVKEVDEFAHAQEPLQGDPFLGRKRAAMVLMRQLPNALGGGLVELEFADTVTSTMRRTPLARNGDLQSVLR